MEGRGRRFGAARKIRSGKPGHRIFVGKTL
jgi:hypothetical protein